jgi:hypothetical protein
MMLRVLRSHQLQVNGCTRHLKIYYLNTALWFCRALLVSQKFVHCLAAKKKRNLVSDPRPSCSWVSFPSLFHDTVLSRPLLPVLLRFHQLLPREALLPCHIGTSSRNSLRVAIRLVNSLAISANDHKILSSDHIVRMPKKLS